jgi:sugar/nucleoside kinase (ribokinase family)
MVICAGTSLIDCIVTEAGSEVVAEDITLSPGGEAFNEAVWLASLGEEVLFCSAVGTDFAGDALRRVLAERGVMLSSDYGGRTPVSLLTVDRRGERKSQQKGGCPGQQEANPQPQAAQHRPAGDQQGKTALGVARQSDRLLPMVFSASIPAFLPR